MTLSDEQIAKLMLLDVVISLYNHSQHNQRYYVCRVNGREIEWIDRGVNPYGGPFETIEGAYEVALSSNNKWVNNGYTLHLLGMFFVRHWPPLKDYPNG